MAKFYGVIGYVITKETRPGVWTDDTVEKFYKGDVLQNQNRWNSNENVNDDFTISNKISIVSDSYSYENFSYIKYVKWLGANWKVISAEILRPRIILTIGGVYNGKTP